MLSARAASDMREAMATDQSLSPRSVLINFIRADDTIIQSGKNELINQIRVYGDSVHKLMLEAFPDGEGMVRFLRTIEIRSDREVREFLVYRDILRTQRVPFTVIAEVRQSLGLSDLSSAAEGSKRREGISAVLKVAVASRTRWWMLDNTRGLAYTENFELDQMTAPLAEFIMDHAESVDDIISYVTEREREPRDVDLDNLREYLNHVAPAVRDGLL